MVGVSVEDGTRRGRGRGRGRGREIVSVGVFVVRCACNGCPAMKIQLDVRSSSPLRTCGGVDLPPDRARSFDLFGGQRGGASVRGLVTSRTVKPGPCLGFPFRSRLARDRQPVQGGVCILASSRVTLVGGMSYSNTEA